MNSSAKEIISDFIEELWNQNKLENLDLYLHPNFRDHSLPSSLPPDKKGTALWIEATSRAFVHTTLIEDMVAENDRVMVKINMILKHIGLWRGIEPTGTVLTAIGYRHFQVADNRILNHWALIDGNAIESQLKNNSNGCKIQA